MRSVISVITFILSFSPFIEGRCQLFNPVAVDDAAITDEDTPVTIDILSNDTDEDVDSGIDPATVDLDPSTDGQQTSSPASAAGTFMVDNAGVVTFTPTQNYSGSASASYTVNDLSGATSNIASITVEVSAVNDPPVINSQSPDRWNSPEDASIAIELSNLNVSDPDNTYPTGFTLSIAPGPNYTVNGSNVVPASNYVGPLMVGVTVNDGSEESAPFTIEINITPVNDPPVITGQQTVSIPAGSTVEVLVSHLVITDPDADDEFQIASVGTGTNYTVSGNSITTSVGFSGNITVPVTISDGTTTSAPFSLVITVEPTNGAPTITGQKPVSTPEDTPITITTSMLTISDPNSGDVFSIASITDGANYSVSGVTVRPDENYSGTITVPVRVTDGTAQSAPFNLVIEVTPVNDPPVITGQKTLTTQEDEPIGILFTDLTVSDPDNTYPAGFTLHLSDGANYTVSNNTIVPAPNFTGTLTVPITVTDGVDSSPVFQLKISVVDQNDPPVITGQVPLSTNEDQSITVLVSHVTISDPDNTSGFAISVLPGTNYTATGNVVQPAPNFNGVLTVPVRVSDGTNLSEPFNLQITVNPVNDPPQITGQVELSTNEEQPLEIQLAHLVVTDLESTYPFGFTLAVLTGTNYTVSGTTITPAANFVGVLTVNVRVNDGQADSQTFALKVTVNGVNDPPVITGQQALNTPEDTPITIQVSHLVISDPDHTSGFTLTVSDGTNYTRSGNTITPAQDFNGTLTIPVQVRDAGSAASNVFDFKLQVTPVNDPPVIIGQKALSTTEDTPIVLKVADLEIVDPDNTTFTLQILAGQNYTFSGTTVTPAQDFNGTINVNVRVSDGAAQSQTFVVQIQVGDANDAPVITGQVALNVDEDQSITLQREHFTVTDPDNTYPNDFTLTVNTGPNYTVTGTTVKPNPDYFGTLRVPVVVNDGVNNSPVFQATITVNPINDPPSFDPIPDQDVVENSGSHQITIRGISPGPLETTQSVVFVASSSNTNIVDNPAIAAYTGGGTTTLTYQVKPNASGTVTITVNAIDNGTPARTFTSTFQVRVEDVNAPPTLNSIADVTVQEDSPMREVALSGITAGPGENQALTVTVATDRPELFDPQPSVVYQSPNSTGALRLTPKRDAFGTANITVTVTDNGSSTAPNVNHISRSFKFIIQPVNDPPVITSVPGTTAVVQERYTYAITSTDIENQNITYTFTKPAWLTFSAQGATNGTLTGIPTSGGTANITVVATDASGATATQSFTININTRPDLKTTSIVVTEDQPVSLPVQSIYTDADGDPVAELMITALPRHGSIMVGNTVIAAQTPIPSTSFASLVYLPNTNYNGLDTVRVNASDGKHYSRNATYIAISVTPVNDPPYVAHIEGDTLAYEVDGMARAITSEIVIEDPDDAIVTGADIAFARPTYKRDVDILTFQNTATITGTFDPGAGVLELKGEASAEEYAQAIRTVLYNNLETVEPVLELKTLLITLTDGKAVGPPTPRHIMLTYSFTDLDIPSGFTPNGDQINDTWYIAPAGGDLANAEIKVYNHRGVVVYETKGFHNPWDGTYKGNLMPAGTYFYTIDLKLKNQKTYKGTVTILY